MNKRNYSEEYIKRVKLFHEEDAKYYTERRYRFKSITQLGYIIRREIARTMVGDKKGNLLDIGCGPGTFVEIMDMEERKIFATDLSLEMVSEAKKRNEDIEKLYCSVGNLINLGFRPDVFDVVICIGVMGYIPNPFLALSEIYRVMKPGAEAVIQTSNSNSIKEILYEKWVPAIKNRMGINKKKGWGIDFPLYSYNKNEFDELMEKVDLEL